MLTSECSEYNLYTYIKHVLANTQKNYSKLN